MSPRTTTTPSKAPATSTQTSTQASSSTKPPTERVAKRAYEKWLQRGCAHGYDLQDWAEAEAEVTAEMNKQVSPSSALSGVRR